ncbi:MAG: gas vesicle protein [Planctomycetota bacterium]
MQQQMIHAVQSSTLADVLERVLDKGIVIAGDIKVKLCDIELLTIQIRLMIASVDKAREIGMDWWVKNPEFSSKLRDAEKDREIESLKTKVASLERGLPGGSPKVPKAPPPTPSCKRSGAKAPHSKTLSRRWRGKGRVIRQCRV